MQGFAKLRDILEGSFLPPPQKRSIELWVWGKWAPATPAALGQRARQEAQQPLKKGKMKHKWRCPHLLVRHHASHLHF